MRDYSKIRINETAWQNKSAWKLYQANWRLCHEIVELRDGYACVIPDCSTKEGLQLDHCFSRMCKILFFDVRNLNYLCPDHHTHKTSRKGQWVDKMVDQITAHRAGDEWFENSMDISKTCCPDFRKLFYQEQMNINLREDKQELMLKR